eukprot:TRINITY_DN3061_c0_g1_i1.p1 TRINITY_DN3061_c0_g1~~TRINITY_DN3061_c0_g1_i1.p1  ORF type:complete len:516 (-),score=99.75 TRINITY_DN3061_c0_g1_i1:9-1556(-)
MASPIVMSQPSAPSMPQDSTSGVILQQSATGVVQQPSVHSALLQGSAMQLPSGVAPQGSVVMQQGSVVLPQGSTVAMPQGSTVMMPQASTVLMPQSSTGMMPQGSTVMMPQRSSNDALMMGSAPSKSSTPAAATQSEDRDNGIEQRSVSALGREIADIQHELQVAMQQRDMNRVRELMAQRENASAQQQHLRLHPPPPEQARAPWEEDSDDEDSDDSDDIAYQGTGAFRRVSAQMAGLAGGHVSQQMSVADFRAQGMPTPQAQAQYVAQHRNEILFSQFQRLIMCFAACAVVLTLLLFGLFIWHAVMYFQNWGIACSGSLPVLNKVVMGTSLLNLVLSSRIFCMEEEGVQMPGTFKWKDTCVMVLLVVMGVNVVGLYFLNSNHKGAFGQALEPCRVAAPGLWAACVAHAVGLIVYSVYLAISFCGVGNMLSILMERGLLRTRGAAPEGAMEHNTVKPDHIDENDNECSICLEELTLENSVMTKDCRHIFHRHCLKHWMQVNRFCPLCRTNIGNVF